MNRLRKAYFQKPYDVVSHNRSFDEYIDYDKNGNIDRLQRFADQNEYGNVIEIDALGYHYEQHSNKLMKVTDATNFSAGFSDDGEDGDDSPDQNDDYAYDDNGNMISDENKGITSIKYNHLNLPTEISFVNGRIHYLYNATGVKVGKSVIQGSEDPVVTDYLGGFQYVKNELQFFPHPEGYVSVVKFGPDNLVINYAYQYKDHLGNIRLNFGKDPETNVLKVLEENHYYPFGLKHQNYNTGRRQLGKKEEILAGNLTLMPAFVLPTEEKPMVYKYKYNGKEWQDELGLNFYDYHARNYDPAIGRWMNIDPLAETSRRWSPFTYCYNNPMVFVDPDGMRGEWWDAEGKNKIYDEDKGEYTKHATEQDKKFGEALRNSGPEGEKTFKELTESDTKNMVEISDEKSHIPGQTGFVEATKVSEDGKKVLENKMTIYMGTINEVHQDIMASPNAVEKYSSAHFLDEVVSIIKTNNLTPFEMAVGVMAHEIKHTLSSNYSLRMDERIKDKGKYGAEFIPFMTQIKVQLELANKK